MVRAYERTLDGTYNYTYDTENRLTQVNRTSDNSLVSTYTYYFNGLRKTKTVNGVTTTYNWDRSNRLVKETTSDGNTWLYYYDSKGNLVGGKKNSQTYLYHTNLRGDVVSITDYAGNILVQYNYDPWGSQISFSGTLVQPLRYAGYYLDEETGLYYLQARYYSPVLGRFLTRDGYGKNIDYKNPQTLNLYAYCNNNPVNNVDPDGNNPALIRIGIWLGSQLSRFGSFISRIGSRAEPYLEELEQSGVKYNAKDIVGIVKNPNGVLSWLETGNSRAGLQHIMERHSQDFSRWGLTSEDKVGKFIMDTVQKGGGTSLEGGGTIYNVVVNGVSKQLMVVSGSNGFIVTAHPYSP